MLAADLTAVAQRRHSEAPKLIHLLRGDLDWIVMKALEKDRTRRYETANGLAMDVQRYLHNEPVVARPPSTIYKFQKLALRNKTIFAAAGAGMAALIIGLILSLFLYAQEKAALKRAMAAEESEKQLRQQAEKNADASRLVSRAGLLLMGAKYDESEKILRDIPPHDTLVPFYNVFGSAHARRGEWLESLTNWNYVVQFAPADHIGYQYLAPLLVQMNNLDGYRNSREQILRQFGDTTDSRIAERMVKASLILPAPPDEMAVISRMAAVAGNVSTNGDHWGYNFLAKGLAEYRNGNYNEAVHLLQRILPEDIGSRPRTEAYLILAMTQHKLNQPEASRASFAKAMEVVNKLPKGGDFDDDWHDWIIIHVLLREALGLNPNFGNPVSSAAANVEIPGWQLALTKAGWKFQSRKADDGSWEVDLEEQPVTDISALHGADISELSLMRTAVANLEPLRGMPLKKLWLASTKVTDLSPLRGIQLLSLQISGTAVTNLEPLRGMPLRDLRMTDCTNITSLEPIAGNRTLENVILPANAKGFEFLRGVASLKKLSFRYDPGTKSPAQSAAEFWADYDRKQSEAKTQ
jgi:tetratricopeptide (TPR) repeat protein